MAPDVSGQFRDMEIPAAVSSQEATSNGTNASGSTLTNGKAFYKEPKGHLLNGHATNGHAFNEPIPLSPSTTASDHATPSSSVHSQLSGHTNGVDGSSERGIMPIAICGMAFRYPGGVRTQQAFQDVLYDGIDLRGPIPESRFNIEGFDAKLGKKGAIKPHHGYFLQEDVGCIDASFFSMTKAEVEKTDPQDRIMLEVVRECFENAGVRDYRGELVGCYVGTFGEDWLRIHAKEPQKSGGYNFEYDMFLANRMSYEFDLRGPSMVIKTGCSASLVALHEACRALQHGDCDAAIVGGSSLILGPDIYQTMSTNGVVSPEGSCKTFDASADGFARAEAVNAIYVKRLDDAIRDGNPIRAIIRNTASNSDGRSDGLMAPNADAHEAMIRKVYKDANLDPGETAFIECHGTGTPTGDPIETCAVGNVWKDGGIFIGSSKPNFGHSEGASGLTGLLKAVMALESKTIPPNIKFNTPNPKIKFKEWSLTVPTKPLPWPSDRAERISVNSFGIGGTNAHCVVESVSSYLYGPRKHLNGLKINGNHPQACDPSANILMFSGNSQDAARQVATINTEYLQQHPDRVKDFAYTLARRREWLPHRCFAVVSGGQVMELSSTLKITTKPPPLALVFSGQGAQWPQMGRELIEQDPLVHGDLRLMDEALSDAIVPPSWTLEKELLRPKEDSRVYQAELSQPLCTAIQICLVNALKRCNISADAVVGHSSGEIAAAYACGALTMREAILSSYYRGLVTKYQSLTGAMAAIGLSAEDTAAFLINGVVIAAENSPKATTISGDSDKLDQVLETIKRERPSVLARRLQVDMAYHSHHMAGIAKHYLVLLQAEMGKMQGAPQVPMFSTVLGEPITTNLTPGYWIQNLTSPVRFHPAVKELMKSIPQAVLLEIGPHSQLAGPLRQIGAESRISVNYISAMIRGGDCRQSLLSATGQIWQYNIPIDFAGVYPNGKVLTDLPAYPWDHSASYWHESRISKEWRARPFGHHDLLGLRVHESTSIEPLWRCMFDLDDVPWMADHKVKDDIVFPFAGFICMAGEAIRQLTGATTGYSIKHMTVPTALILTESKPVEILTSLRPRKLTDSVDSDYWEFSISAYTGSMWIKHSEGSIKPLTTPVAVQAPRTTLPRRLPAAQWYKTMANAGLNYGPEFQGIKSVEVGTTVNRATAEISGNGQGSFIFHPAAMDSCFQLIFAAAARGLGRNNRVLKVPTLMENIDVYPSVELMTADAWSLDDGRDIGIDCVANGNMAFRVRGVRLVALEDYQNSLESDVHAAARIEWSPDLDFVDMGTLFTTPGFNKKDKQALEEMVLLCILDSSDLVENLSPGLGHYTKFREWLRREKDTAAAGGYPSVVGNALGYTKLPDHERKTAIHERRANISSSSPLIPTADGILRLWENMEKLFTGQSETLEVLMEGGVLTDIYSSMGFGLSKLIKALTTSKPALRILEVGAGTGGTTARILQDLVGPFRNPPYSVYTYTDVSSGFFPEAAKRFSSAPNMEYKVFDIDQSPLNQGFEAESYDVILAPNVVHATAHLNNTLTNLKQLLRPDGLLVLVELAPVGRWLGYMFGNFSGWWLGEADDRKWEPWIKPERWDEELKHAGFTGVDTLVLDIDEPFQDCIGIISQRQAKPPRPDIPSLTVLCDQPKADIVQSLITGYQAKGTDVTVIKFGDSLPPQDRPILVTLDLESYFFENISSERFTDFQSLCREHKIAKLLWLMSPCQIRCADPRPAQTLGAMRGVQAELGVPFYTLEISPAEPKFLDLVMGVFGKICAQDDTESIKPDVEFAVDDGVIKVPRFESFSLEQEVSVKSASKDDSVKQVEIRKPGSLESLYWADVKQQDLGPDEVEIEARALGVNFRDVMIAMGIVPSSGNHTLFGLEATGLVKRVGANVNHLAIGDRVVGVAPDKCFSTHPIVRSELCVKLHDQLGFEEAVSLPCIFLTCMQALLHIGQLQSDQSVLIHSACGGIGHAAVQLCQMVGAKIYVTVGNEAKVEYAMNNFGIPGNHIFHSRDDSFVVDLMRETGGQGVDLVLNSLSGKLLHASWNCVAEFGKMIEIGKRDVLGFGQLAMEPFAKNRSYCCFDLVHMYERKPQDAAKLLHQLMDMCRAGQIHPAKIPLSVFEATDVEKAFRHLQNGDLIGKTVVKLPEELSHLVGTARPNPVQLDPDASYLITGGLGGLGKGLLRWMTERGARSVVLLSRSAGKSDDDKMFFQELQSMGCTAIAVAGKAEDMETLQVAIAAAPKPIKGIIHMAMVLRDNQLTAMPYEDWGAVVAPKVDGAWNLHNSFEGHQLDFFLMTSSAVAPGGNHAGQSNYMAANCFLEALCQYRRKLGLPAATLSISPVADAGFVASHAAVKKQLDALGFYFLTEKEFLDYVELMLLSQRENCEIADMPQGLAPWKGDGNVVMGIRSVVHLDDPKCQAGWRRDRRFGSYHNVRDTSGTGQSSSGNGIKAFLAIAAKDPEILSHEDGVQNLAQEIGSKIFTFMMKEEAEIDTTLTLRQIGMDSLMAIELRRWWKQTFGLEISTLEIMGAESLRQLGQLAADGMTRKWKGQD